jgi:casein kinase II subunit beta
MYGLALETSDDEGETSEDSGWVSWFCRLKGHELFAEVEEEYVRDNFNLYGLRGRFTFYDHALEMILSSEAPDEDDLADTEFLEIQRDATDLYGLIHARYIVSPRGLQVMREKYLKGTFGTCPRVLCHNQHVLPIGTTEEPRCAQVKIFCPKCEQVYSPKSKYKELDGAYFGTSFPQIFLQTFPSLVPLEITQAFVPRVFGFRLHKQRSLIARKLEDEGIVPQQSSTRKGEMPSAAKDAMEGVSAQARDV